MSEREEVENAPALEDLFLSREFGKHDTTHAPGPHREFERAHTARPQAAVRLEDLFRSAEFGQTAAAAPADDVLFAPVPRRPLTPLSPLVASGGHDTATHRRNRFVATASGVAAALLVAIGLATNAGKSNPGNNGTVAAGGTVKPSGPSSITQDSGFDGNVTTPGGGTIALASGTTGSAGIRTAGNTFGGHSGGGSTGTSTGGSTGSGTGKGGTGGGTGGTGGTPPTAPSGSVLTPVVSLVGHVVVSTGVVVTDASAGLGNTVPPITPVTNVLGGLGGTVSGLGWSIVKLA